MVINTEWGALGNTGSLDFVRTRWDHAVDAGSKNFGKQVFISAVICLLMFIFCFVISCIQNFSWTGWKVVCSKVYEKLISGMYLGELFRQVVFSKNFRNLKSTFNLFQVLLEAVDKHLLFPGVDVMRTLGERDCLQTRHISAIESDGPGEYSATWEVLRELGLEKLATASDCRVIRWGKNNF